MLPATVLSCLLVLATAQDQRFYFTGAQQPRFLPTFQSPSNDFYQHQNIPYRQNTGFAQSAQSYNNQNRFPQREQYISGGDLQTSDLPPHLAQTLPQYQFTGFPSPTVRQPVPFRLAPKQNQPTAYLYEESEEDQQISKPHPFQPAKPITPSTFKPPHSHYLSHSAHHDPSQTETFLGQITLQSPELPEVPQFKPRDFPFQQPHGLVDQFGNQPKITRPSRPRTANKTYKDFSESVDQSLDTYEDKDTASHSAETVYRKPSVAHLDRPLHTNSVNSGRPYYNTRPRVVNNPETSIRSRGHANNYVVNSNGDVVTTGRNGFKPKPTTTTPAPTTKDRPIRFRPSTKPTGKPLAYHLKSNKQPFVPKHPAGTSTTENNNFDFESLLEDPIEQSDEPYDHKDDVEVIHSETEAEEPTTIVEDPGTTVHSSLPTSSAEYTTHPDYDTITVSEEQEQHINDYSGETTSDEIVTLQQIKLEQTTSKPVIEQHNKTVTTEATPTEYEAITTEYDYDYEDEEKHNSTALPEPHEHEQMLGDQPHISKENQTNDTLHEESKKDSQENKPTEEENNSHIEPNLTEEQDLSSLNDSHTKDDINNETYNTEEIQDENIQDISDNHTAEHTQDDTILPSAEIQHDQALSSQEQTSTEVPKTEISEINTSNITSEKESKEKPENVDKNEEKIEITTEAPLSTVESSFEVLTMKPSLTMEDNNFNDFVDSTLIDNIPEEPSNVLSSNNHSSEESKEVPVPTPEKPKIEEPVLIGEAVVSVVTTKSVVNGTLATPSTTVMPPVTQQIKAPETSDNSSESWIVVASVQTSRSVSGARYLNFPVVENETHKDNEDNFADPETVTEDPAQKSDETKKPISSSTESIIDKLDRVQSELSSGFLSGDFTNGGNNIAVISETMPQETTTTSTTTTTTERTTTHTTLAPVVIRKFSPNNRPSTTRAPKKPRVFETIKQDDISSLLPAGFKPKYQNHKSTSTTEAPVDLDLPQGDQPLDSEENPASRSDNKTNKKTVVQGDISALLPPGYKPPKETNETKDPVKTLEGYLSKIRNESAKQNKPKDSTKLLENAKPVDISSFLPPGYKASKEPPTTSKPKTTASVVPKAEPVDISAFLPPGYKSPKEETAKPKNTTNLLSKATPVDISSFLPPGFKPDKSSTTEKPKGVQKLLEDADPVDVAAFLPPGYTGFKKFSKKPSTETPASSSETPASSSEAPPSSSTAASSGGFKVVFPSRPGGNRKTVHRITTPKYSEAGGNVQTAPSIHKGWPSRATTEFTGWPTPSTTPISIEKLLEAARTATSHTSSSPDDEFSSTPSTTTTSTTTTTTTPRPTTPGICVSECSVGGIIKLVGGAKWIPELLDRNTKEWQILANEVETQLEKAYSKSAVLNRWYKKVTVEEFSPGSVIVDYSVELTDLGRQVDTLELKRLFHDTLQTAPVAAASGRSIDFSDTPKEVKSNVTQLALGNFIVDPKYTDFVVLVKPVVPTVGYADENVFLPQWAIAVIVIGLASLLFVIIFGVTVLVNRQKNAKKKAPTPLTEEMLNELNKNHMGGLDNYGAEDLYNMEDVWNDRPYDVKPPKKRSSGSIHDNSMSNLYDSWRSEWNGYYYNAYYGNPGSSNSGYTRRRSDYDTNF